MSPTKKLSLFAVPFLLAMLAAPASALAGGVVGLDLGVAVPLGDDSDDQETGYSGALRFGYSLPIPALLVQPEVRVAYTSFPIEEIDDGLDFYDVRAGGRVGVPVIPLLLRGGAYAHVGYSWVDSPVDDLSEGAIETSGGIAYDAGLFLDVVVLPLVNVGVHAGYNASSITAEVSATEGALEDEETAEWIDAGVHVEIEF